MHLTDDFLQNQCEVQYDSEKQCPKIQILALSPTSLDMSEFVCQDAAEPPVILSTIIKFCSKS